MRAAPGSVLPPVHGQLVTGGRHLPDESGLALGMRGEQEERSRHPPGSEQVQEQRRRVAVRAVVEGQCDVRASAHAGQPGEQRPTQRGNGAGGRQEVGRRQGRASTAAPPSTEATWERVMR